MIPKIVHTAWFGHGEKAEHFRKCIATWPRDDGWQIRESNEEDFPSPPPYMYSVLKRREWVKATELARLVAVYRFGGIYMDCDVEVLRPLDELLQYRCFFGRQQDGLINGAVFGAEPRSEVIGQLIDNFPSDSSGTESALEYGPKYLSAQIPKFPDGSVTILPPAAFYPYFWNEKDPGVYPVDAFTVHRWAGSWA